MTEITSILTLLETKLASEQANVQQVLTKRYSEDVTKLRSAYQMVLDEVSSRFREISEILESAKREIKAAETNSSFSLSKEIQVLIGSVAHLRDKEQGFIDMEKEVTDRVQLVVRSVGGSEFTIASILTFWKVSPCTCPKCDYILNTWLKPRTELREEPIQQKLPAKRQEQKSSVLRPTYGIVQDVPSNQITICVRCHSVLIETVQTDLQVWKRCSQCHFLFKCRIDISFGQVKCL